MNRNRLSYQTWRRIVGVIMFTVFFFFTFLVPARSAEEVTVEFDRSQDSIRLVRPDLWEVNFRVDVVGTFLWVNYTEGEQPDSWTDPVQSVDISDPRIVAATVSQDGLVSLVYEAPPAPEPVAEDDPDWDCATMGNQVCGVQLDPHPRVGMVKVYL